jgi:hypothetical protein
MIMLDGLVRLAQRWSGSQAPLSRLSEAKFRAEVRPESEVEYELRRGRLGPLSFDALVKLGDRVAMSARFSLEENQP